MTVLYRKYRPQTFAEVVGQNHIKVTLGNEIAQDAIAHAYLFVGPRGTGKTTLARLFVRAVNCEKRKPGSFEPCNECNSCTTIKEGRSLDIFEMDAATHTQVDNVRDNIIASTRIPPISPKGYKVFIIDEIHMLSKHAFNALLKTIEEPPARVVFILATTDIYKVPETIISRCQRFDFKKIPQQLISKRLLDICVREGITVPASTIASIARRSDGCLRDAESLLGQVMSMEEKGAVTEDAAALVIPPSTWDLVASFTELLQRRDLPGSLSHIHTLTEQGMDLEAFHDDAIEFIRQVLLKKSIGPAFQPDVDEKTAVIISKHAELFSLAELRHLMEILMREAYRAKNSFIPQLPLELVAITFSTEGAEPLQPPVTPIMGTPSSLSGTPSVPVMPSGGLSVLKQEWNSILTHLKDYNHSLSVFLKVAHPLSLANNRLTIGFKYDFHANTVQESKNKKIAEEAFSKILKNPIVIDCILDPQYTLNHQNFIGASEQEVQDVLSVMGGGELI